MRGSDPRLARLLRWYPRAWRDRYGVEFLAMVEDTLAGRRPGLRLRVNVAWAGLRQRGHDVLAGPVATRLERLHKVLWGRWWEAFLAGLAVALLEYDLAQPAPAHPRAWAVTTVLDALLAVAALAGVSVLVGLAAVASAFRRFLRDGGWTLIRRRVAWAVVTTAASGGGLAVLALTSGWAASITFNAYAADYLLVLNATALALAAAVSMWTSSARMTARRLDLSLRAQVAQATLGSVLGYVGSVMAGLNVLLIAATQFSVPQLIIGLVVLIVLGVTAPARVRRARRRARRQWERADSRVRSALFVKGTTRGMT